MPVDGVSGVTRNNTDHTYNPDHLDKVPDSKDTDYSYNPSYTVSVPSKQLTSTDFLKLLAAQLQYQDMTNPMSNTEMMSTLTQMSSMTATNSMVDAMSLMTGSMNDVLTVNLTSYATGMMGKEVTVSVVDKDGKPTGEKITGKVDGISLYEGSPMVYVDGKRYALSQVMTIGDVPEEDNKEEDKGDGSDGEQKEEQTDKTDKV